MHSGTAAMFILFLKVSKPSGEDKRESYCSDRYSLEDLQHTVVGGGGLFVVVHILTAHILYVKYVYTQ